MYKYQDIANQLKKKFHDGNYKPGEQLPDQATLAKEFGTTRMTLRKALQSLIVEGVIYTKQGSGTYLRNDFERKGTHLESLIDSPVGGTSTYANRNVTSRVLKFDATMPPEDVRKQLMLEPGEPVYDIERVRYVDGAIYCYEHTAIPTKISTLNEDILKHSIYQHLEKVDGIHISGSHRQVSAIEATKTDVEALGAKLKEPVLLLKQLTYTAEGMPFEYNESHFPFRTTTIIADVEMGPNWSPRVVL